MPNASSTAPHMFGLIALESRVWIAQPKPQTGSLLHLPQLQFTRVSPLEGESICFRGILVMSNPPNKCIAPALLGAAAGFGIGATCMYLATDSSVRSLANPTCHIPRHTEPLEFARARIRKLVL